jgi:hypothetical protein
MTLSPAPNLDLVLGLPVGLLVGAAVLALGTWLVLGRVRRP